MIKRSEIYAMPHAKRLALVVVILCSLIAAVRSEESSALPGGGQHAKRNAASANENPPNVLIFVVDDLGWNQVGYHAAATGNDEIKTPNMDAAAAAGIELNRGYVTPWCGPSRAAIMTGRTNVYNANVSNVIHSFDDDIGFVSGLPVGTQTIANAFKKFGESIGKKYTAYYDGKWGIGGTAWSNTPLGMGFDFFRGSWGTGLETCDAVVPTIAVIAQYVPFPFDKDFGPLLLQTLPGYWEQDPTGPDSDMCPYFEGISDELLTAEEKTIACKTIPRTPPKIIDLDLLDKVVEQIETHDYENSGPLLQVFSTFMLHLPMAYPKEYNEAEANDNFSNGMPEYFASGETKPPASNDDSRWAANQGVRFIDDLFGSTMQAIKDAGQWNNTIVYLTSDNGGVIYSGTANNNYPLRASKFSPFEGGIRVPQFISGGWIDQHLPADRTSSQSNTYIFPNDIAPTLLEMAGADVSFLLEGRTGAPYGNPMWEHIKNSIDPTMPSSSHQKIRKVSYTPDWFFDVQADRTMKNFFTGNNPMNVPRLWEPIYPKNGDLIMDPLYLSVKPCRPGGVASDCCSLDIEEDWQETKPLAADCGALHLEAKNLFAIEGGCPKDGKGRNTNQVCIENGELSPGTSPENLSLWTHYGAAGPFTNSKGQPLKDLPMKCACHGLTGRASASDVDYFIVRNLGPSQCGKSGPLFSFLKPPQSISCDGSFAFDSPPAENLLDQYEAEGFDLASFEKTLRLEQKMLSAIGIPAALNALLSYINREGYTDWPNVGKFPFNANMDTCKAKGVVPAPYPVLAISPYLFGAGDATVDFDRPSFLGLCSPFSLTQYFCPSHQNAELQPVVEWHFDRFDPHGIFADGTRWEPMGLIECSIRCQVTAQGTAYIGDGPNGLVV